MNLNEVKKIIPSNGERYILMENGQPTVVLLSFKDYQEMSDNNSEKKEDTSQPAENIAEEIKEGKAQPTEEPKQKLTNELTLEDLPF